MARKAPRAIQKAEYYRFTSKGRHGLSTAQRVETERWCRLSSGYGWQTGGNRLQRGLVCETMGVGDVRLPIDDSEGGVDMVEGGDGRRRAVIEKVRALWAQADDASCTEEERAAFAAKAAELMAKYEIEEIALSVSEGHEPAIVFGQFLLNDHATMLVPDERMLLAGAIARNFECRGVIMDLPPSADPVTGKPKKGGVYYECIGYENDYEMVKMLYYSLVVDMIAGVLGEQQKDRNYQREYAGAYVDTVNRRLKDMYRRVNDWVDGMDASDSTAIAIRSRLQKVQDTFQERYPKLGKVRYRETRHDPNARSRGAARGRAADLGGGKIGSGSGNNGSIGQAKKELT